MPRNALTALQAYAKPGNLTRVSTPAKLVEHAVRLPERDRSQLGNALRGGQYDMACVFAWYRTIEALRRQLSGLGDAFFEEILLVSESQYDSGVISLVSEGELISIAEEIGYLTRTESLRLRQSHEIIQHFSNPNIIDSDEELTKEDAIQIVRACIQGVLAKNEANLSDEFARFLSALENETLSKDDHRVALILDSQYFFWRACIGVILNKIKNSKGAQFEHVARNAVIIIPLLWDGLKSNEKWQIGRAYSEVYANGNKKSVSGLRAVLTKVSGFDYVPENLRSSTFAEVAHKVLRAHESFDNFYKEPTVMKEFYSLGTTIPSPAFPISVTATLAVWLGNQYGHSYDAEATAKKILTNISYERWGYYFREVLPNERIILAKLARGKPARRFSNLAEELDWRAEMGDKKFLKNLLRAGNEGEIETIKVMANKLYK